MIDHKTCTDCPEKGPQPIELFHERVYFREDTKSDQGYVSRSGRCDTCRKKYQREKSRKQRQRKTNRKYFKPNQDLSDPVIMFLYGH